MIFDFKKPILTIERIQIKPSLRLTLPKPQVIRRLGIAPRNHDVVCHSQNLLSTKPDSSPAPVLEALGGAVEADFVAYVETGELEFRREKRRRQGSDT
jgi:hypothetical protein